MWENNVHTHEYKVRYDNGLEVSREATLIHYKRQVQTSNLTKQNQPHTNIVPRVIDNLRRLLTLIDRIPLVSKQE